MFNAGFIGFLTFCFIGFTAINRVLEGAFINSADLTIINQLTVFRDLTIFGLFSIPVPNLDMITVALPMLITFNYSFFGGPGGLVLYALYSLTAAASFGLFIAFVVSLASSYLSRTR